MRASKHQTMKPVVSVLIATHQRPNLLRRAIPTVLSQTFSNLELIIVENGQSYEGKAVADEFQRTDPRLRYMYRQEASLPLARNTGVLASRGAYVAFLDDDDEWLPTKLEQQVAVAKQDPTIGLVTCKGRMVNETGQVVRIGPQFAGPISFKTLLTDWCCIWSPSGILIRRACFERIGVFDPIYRFANDYEFYFRLARRYRLVRVEEPLFRYTVHSGNMSRNLEPMMEECIAVLRSLRATERFGVTRQMIRERIAKYHHAMAVEARDTGRYPDAARHYLNAVWSDPLIGRKIAWSRFANPVYRLLRPYANVAQCGWRSLGGLTR